MGIIQKLVTMYKIRKPIEYARELGVSIGNEVRFISMPSFGSEPYLIEIGNHVTIASGVTFLTHDGATWVFRDNPKYKDVVKYGKIRVLDNCFIENRTIIMPNVTIGPNSVVAAGSVVTKDVPRDSVYGGVPAKFLLTTDDYAEKCLAQTPSYNKENYKNNKREEIIKMLKTHKVSRLE